MNKGFSLVELIVSIGIVSIVTAITFAGYREMGRTTMLEDQASMAVSVAEDARRSALSAIEVLRDGDQVEFFTVTFNEDNLVLFEGTDSERVHELEGGVEVIDGYNRAVGFRPPDPEIVFLNSNLEPDFEDERCIEFVINYAQDSQQEDIILRINRAGLIQLTDEEICNE